MWAGKDTESVCAHFQTPAPSDALISPVYAAPSFAALQHDVYVLLVSSSGNTRAPAVANIGWKRQTSTQNEVVMEKAYIHTEWSEWLHVKCRVYGTAHIMSGHSCVIALTKKEGLRLG